MNEFLIYLVKANVALVLFYLGYRFLLQNLTFYKLNRHYFLLAFLFASLYPAVDWQGLFQQRGEIPATLISLAPEWHAMAPAEESLGLGEVVERLFWITMALFAVRLLIQLFGIWRIHRNSLPAVWNLYAYRRSAEDIVPFSFWKSVYMNPDRHQENEYDQILKHEYVHVQQMHSLDILLTELAILFFWYNPFCWLLRRSVRENIEFITDRRVLASGVDRKSYQYSLLNISTLSFQPVLGTHFNFKNLKKRIMMMNKKRSSSLQLSKYAFIIPVVLVGSFIFGLSHAANHESQPEEISIPDTIPQNPAVIVLSHESDTTKSKPIYVLDGKVIGDDPKEIMPENIAKVEVLKGESATNLYGEEGKNGVIQVTSKESKFAAGTPLTLKAKKSNSDERTFGRVRADMNPVVYIDEVKSSQAELDYIPTSWIKSVEVYKGDRAIELYGEEARDGAIRIKTHQRVSVTLPGTDGDTTVISGYLTKTQYSPEKKIIRRSEDSKLAIDSVDKNTTIFVDGKVVTVKDFKNMDPESFEEVAIRREEDFITLHGIKVKGGIVEASRK